MADALLELHAHVLRDELRVQLGLAHLRHVDLHLRRGVLLPDLVVEDLRQFVDALAAATDDRAGAGGVDVDLDAVGRTLDLDPRDRAQADAALHELTDAGVLQQGGRVALLAVVPIAVVPADHSDPEADGMDLLSH